MSESPATLRDPSPTFVACCARSGSTLLRWLLDAHPEIACPGETDLAVFLSGYVKMAGDLLGPLEGEPLPIERAKAVAEDLFSSYLGVTGKSRWCDKSLSNVFHLEELAATWPEGRFILLHRHCMDFVMNGLEVSPWGLTEYGFAQVAQMSPTDSIIALVAYWIDRTARMLAFEERFAGRCLRLSYEELVTDTEAVLQRVWDFVGVEAVAGIPETAFQIEHSAFGPADHEIWYTNGIHAGSIGRGARLPPDHVAGPLRTSLNEVLGRLGYATVDDRWGSGDRPGEVRAAPVAMTSKFPMAEIRVLNGHEVCWRAVVDLEQGVPILDELGRALAPEFVVVVEQGALPSLCAGTENIGTALRSRTLRYYGALLSFYRDERDVFERIGRFFVQHRDVLEGAGVLPSAPA